LPRLAPTFVFSRFFSIAGIRIIETREVDTQISI
jgi:hypothetical protein